LQAIEADNAIGADMVAVEHGGGEIVDDVRAYFEPVEFNDFNRTTASHAHQCRSSKRLQTERIIDFVRYRGCLTARIDHEVEWPHTVDRYWHSQPLVSLLLERQYFCFGVGQTRSNGLFLGGLTKANQSHRKQWRRPKVMHILNPVLA